MAGVPLQMNRVQIQGRSSVFIVVATKGTLSLVGTPSALDGIQDGPQTAPKRL